ncbi:PR domain zinc finger protein 2 [Trichomycterus rosablanca]|uniref:PR domain zinc finger protein 2 n=1 Tax=Trichomycterus rosablanca TaxID=2290929 RepID=UPI002F35DEAA
MRDSDKEINEEEEKSSCPEPLQKTTASQLCSTETKDLAPSPVPTETLELEEREETDQGDLQLPRSHVSPEHCAESLSANKREEPNPELFHCSPVMKSQVSPEKDAEGDSNFEDNLQVENYDCQYCDHKFFTKQDLELHMNTHPITNQQTNTFKCKYCTKAFGSQVGKRRHERRHENGSKSLNRPELLTGTAFLLNSSRHNDSPSSGSVTSSSPTIMSSQNGKSQSGSDSLTIDAGTESDHPLILDENGESKELHPCKYCNKTFGSHTNMRRHQRRIHERHLMPKGVRRKGMLLQDIPSQQLEQGQAAVLQEASQNVSSPLVYVPSVDTDDEGERENSMVDISKNISENLSLYIDGKILSTSTISSCDVIEVDSSTSTLFGLDAVILNSNQISHALKIETQPCAIKELSVSTQPGPKRRTSTPPIPSVKMETETVSSTSSSSSTASQSPLGSGIFPQATESLAFQKEKAVYLSPKLKQLLQTQDSHKTTLITDHKLTTPLSIASLPAAQKRFKRRTSSPPTPVQSSPSLETPVTEAGDLFALKVPKVESQSTSYSWNVPSKDPSDGTSISGGSACNQQPLDLSSTVGKQESSSSKGPAESVLDLSVQRANAAEPRTKSNRSLHPHMKRKKPNTSMLEKVLMNEYSGLSSAGEEGSLCLESPDTHLSSGSATAMSPASVCSYSDQFLCESASPPSLTPVTMNPSSPSSSSQASSTPPPPVLPTVPSPPPLFQFSDSAFPKLSPKPVDNIIDDTSPSVSKTCHDTEILNTEDENQTSKHLQPDALPQSLEDKKSNQKADFFSKSETLHKDSTSDCSLYLINNEDHVSSDETNNNSKANQSSSFVGTFIQDLNVKADVQTSHSHVHLTTNVNSLSPSLDEMEDSHPSHIESLSDNCVVVDKHLIKDNAEITAKAEKVFSSASPRVVEKTSDAADTQEQDTFTKSFVCNVCQEPFHSIKQLSSHIIDHAVEWPFKCEFCVQLFQNAEALLEHRSSLHGVGRIYICPLCSKEFAFLCNLQQHQSDLHPGQSPAHTTVENGKLRPQNYTDPAHVNVERNLLCSTPDMTPDFASQDSSGLCKDIKTEDDDIKDEQEDPTEELYTTIKIMASEAGKPKCPDVRLGINQHYPSFKPPPFPYHNRTPAGSVASATHFTTHNIPQTFSTAIRCTKCGNSFDNMPELHKHILACANASDKKRYTPKKNPIPLKQIVKQPLNGAFSPIETDNEGQNAFRRMGQPKRLNFNQEVPSKVKMSALNKKKNQLVQKAISQKNKASTSGKKASIQIKQEEHEVHACPYCNREFTYLASLAKHVACSCPQKPAGKKNKGALTTRDKNMKLRSRATDSEIKQEPSSSPAVKSVGKTRTRTVEGSESEEAPASKSKTVTSQVRTKRPASSEDHSAPKSKKGRKSKNRLALVTTSSSALTDDSASQPAAKVQHGGKDIAIKKETEVMPQVKPKKEESVSKKMRKRVGGPVTRSAAVPGEKKIEDPLNSDTASAENKESD